MAITAGSREVRISPSAPAMRATSSSFRIAIFKPA